MLQKREERRGEESERRRDRERERDAPLPPPPARLPFPMRINVHVRSPRVCRASIPSVLAPFVPPTYA